MSDQIYNLAHSFIRQEPKAAARLLEQQDPVEVAAFLENAPQQLAVLVIMEMLPYLCAPVISSADFSTAMIWLNELNNNHLCAVLRHMNKAKQNEFLQQLPSRRRSACLRLLVYNSASLGAWVETDVPVFPQDMPAGDALKRLRQKSFQEDSLIILVDDQRRPVATLSVLALLRSSKTIGSLDAISQPIGEVINGWVTLSAAISHPVWHQQDVVAVVDVNRELIGVIWYSQIRHLLSTQPALIEQQRNPTDGASHDLLQAYAESMLGLIEAVRAGIR